MNSNKKTIIILILCIVIVAVPLVTLGSKGKFSGTDDAAKFKVSEIEGNYKPWFKNIWQPPSAEIESLLFTLQASLGAGFIGYYIGRKRNVQNSSRLREEKQTKHDTSE